MDQQLVCKYCNKTVKSKSGLTLHEKTCQSTTTNREGVDVSISMQANPYDRVESVRESSQEREPGQERKSSGPKSSKPNPFQFGAFLVMADYVPILLDVDFCIALGNHILEHGSPNSAIMAFAHQLNKLDSE